MVCEVCISEGNLPIRLPYEVCISEGDENSACGFGA